MAKEKEKKKEESADEVMNRRISAEAALGAGGGVAAAFKADQLRNAKNADIERRQQSTSKPSPKANTSLTAPKANTSVIPRANTSLTAPKANTGVIPRPNTSVVADRPMRNVTPKAGGGGVASVVSTAARLINPITALLSTTGTLNQGAEFSYNDIRRMRALDEELSVAKAALQASEEAMYDGKMGRFRESQRQNREAAGNQRSPVTGAPSPRLGKAEPNALLEEYNRSRSPDLTRGGPIDPRRSPVTGAPSPRLGEDKAKPKSGKAMVGDMPPEALFAKTHGGPFDPKSSVDQKKMAAITNLMAQEGSASMTPNQFALTIYRTTK